MPLKCHFLNCVCVHCVKRDVIIAELALIIIIMYVENYPSAFKRFRLVFTAYGLPGIIVQTIYIRSLSFSYHYFT